MAVEKLYRSTVSVTLTSTVKPQLTLLSRFKSVLIASSVTPPANRYPINGAISTLGCAQAEEEPSANSTGSAMR